MFKLFIKRFVLVMALVLTPLFFVHAGEKPDEAKIKALIEKLGAADTVERENAEKELSGLGAAASEQLKAATESANPEISVRAKRLIARMAPAAAKRNSYAEVFPADSVLFIEAGDVAKLLENWKRTPFGQFWESADVRKFLTGYRKELLPAEVQADDARQALLKLASGKLVFAIPSPDTIQPEEIDPPLIRILEVNNLQTAEAQTRQMFEGEGDPIRNKRVYKTYTIDEQTNANTLFSQDRVINSLTEKGMEVTLDNLAKPPAKSLAPVVNDLRAQRPNADIVWHLSSSGFKPLVDALQFSDFLDQDKLDQLNAAGFTEGSTIEGALTFNAEGVEELVRVKLADPAKNAGLLAVLQRMAPPAAAAPANSPRATDLMPFQAAMVMEFNADMSKNVPEFQAALLALDRALGSTVRDDLLKAPQNKQLEGPIKPPTGNRAADALNAGGGVDPNNKTGEKIKAAERSAPHIEALAKSGVQLQNLLEQSDGPMCLALFPEQVDVTRVTVANAQNAPPDPDRVPLSSVFAMTLKDTAPLEKMLSEASRGNKMTYKKQAMNGGTLFMDVDEPEEEAWAYWISGHYFAYGSSRDVLELCTAAVTKANQRITARPEYQRHAAKRDPAALVDIFVDSTLWLDMPYKMAQLGFQEPANPWPTYAFAAGFLKDNLMHISVKPMAGGLEIKAQTPLSLLGMLFALWKPLDEAQVLN